MARMPGAAWKPLADSQLHQPLMTRYDGIIYHTPVGSLYSTYGYFMHGNGEGYVGTESTFLVGAFGEIWQLIDTARTADANLEGNPYYLSIEIADSGEGFPAWSGSNVPPMRPEQIVSVARITAWASQEHNFPLVRMPNSLPSSRGCGYHRLGIDPWRVSGGRKYSLSTGKACPGDKRIAQVDEIIELARHGAKPPWPQFHETSPAVRQMQAKLAFNDYSTGKDADAFYGAGTKAAITRLQRAQGWSGSDADGLIGPATWEVITNMPQPPDQPPKDDPNRPLADAWQRAAGDSVRALTAEVDESQSFVDAHPKMSAFEALHQEVVDARHAAQLRWQKLHTYAQG